MDVLRLTLKPHRNGEGHDPHIVVASSPFRVGRRPENDAQILRPEISGHHAVFRYSEGAWYVVDQQSTNGTFVNGGRIAAETKLQLGDTIHFASQGYQVVTALDDFEHVANQTQVVGLSSDIQQTMSLISILNEQRTFPVFQPVVHLATGRSVGWEALGRAVANDEPLAAESLFGLAGRNRQERTLSQQFRKSAVYCASCRFCWPKQRGDYLFINLHPTEIHDKEFLRALTELANSGLDEWYRLVIEMPEAWVGKLSDMERLVHEIRNVGMYVAFDDFGAGQSRISDLLHVPPDFLKLDRGLITQLGSQPVKQGIVKAIIAACRDLNVTTIGEGIETVEERALCKELGVDLGQGFALGRPMRAYDLFQIPPTQLPPECLFVQLDLIREAPVR